VNPSERCLAYLVAGRKEFMTFLPEGTQGVVIQPIGSAGVFVAATDTVRGIGRMDQVNIESLNCRSVSRPTKRVRHLNMDRDRVERLSFRSVLKRMQSAHFFSPNCGYESVYLADVNLSAVVALKSKLPWL